MLEVRGLEFRGNPIQVVEFSDESKINRRTKARTRGERLHVFPNTHQLLLSLPFIINYYCYYDQVPFYRIQSVDRIKS